VAGRLVRRRLLDAAEATALTTLPRPATARMAVTHGDASPDNLVLTAAGGLLAIDEERVAVRPTAFDLARTVCRWPLDRDQERALLSAYARAGGDASQFRRHRLFWVATALSATAAYRMRYHPAALAPIAAHLRRLAAIAPSLIPRPRR
jgi:thiamine kinase-like enzyme